MHLKEQKKEKYFIIDFDSTFTQVEALDILAEISLEEHPDKEERIGEIKRITDLGMDGTLSFRESLISRINILGANKRHLPDLVDRLKKRVTKSFVRNKEFLKSNSQNIFIISNGFKEVIIPIVKEYGILDDHVYANTFLFDTNGNIIGFDTKNVLSENNGKTRQLDALNLNGEVLVIGDGKTDYEIKSGGKADKFFAFTENVERNVVKLKADHVAPSLDEILYVQKMNRAISYPKNRIKVLLLEGIHHDALTKMKDEGYEVELIDRSLDEDELCERITDISILGIRSKTQITERVLSHSRRLHAIGAFCIGTNQIDLEACQHKGVAVFNAPYSNTRSVVELALSEMILLMRNLPDKIPEMHQGIWNKSASNSYEVRTKTLGIIGYGNIGSQLSIMAESLGMKVYFYDLEEKLALGNAIKCTSLSELLSLSDIVTLHVDGRPENKKMIGPEQFSMMKDGVIFLNLSRGNVVNVQALCDNIKAGKIRGAAIDVFPVEPLSNAHPFESVLKGLPNTILTPHIGGSTHEAQIKIADFVPEMLINFINTGNTATSVNFPKLHLHVLEKGHRLIHIHENKAGVLADISKVLASNNINILGQHLKTNETLGYVITDIDKKYNKSVLQELRAISGTIKMRVLY